MLVIRYIGGNDLEGTFPLQWSTLSALEVLSAFSNRLTGGLPPELSTFTALRSL